MSMFDAIFPFYQQPRSPGGDGPTTLRDTGPIAAALLPTAEGPHYRIGRS